MILTTTKVKDIARDFYKVGWIGPCQLAESHEELRAKLFRATSYKWLVGQAIIRYNRTNIASFAYFFSEA